MKKKLFNNQRQNVLLNTAFYVVATRRWIRYTSNQMLPKWNQTARITEYEDSGGESWWCGTVCLWGSCLWKGMHYAHIRVLDLNTSIYIYIYIYIHVQLCYLDY